MPLTATEVLALGLEQMERTETLRVELNGKLQAGDVSVPFRLVSQMDLPDRAHGTYESQGEQLAFLRLGDEDYIAYPDYGFEEDYYNEGGAVFLDLLKPLLKQRVADEQLTELERQPDETIDGREFYHITFHMDMREFVETLAEEKLRGIEINGRGELFIDQETLQPHRFTVECESCFLTLGSDLDLLANFTLTEFNQPVSIPGPDDEPVLLITPVPDEHGDDASSATALILDQEVDGIIDPRSDVDFFSFEARASDAFAITVALETLFDSELFLYDTDGRSELAYSDDYDVGYASQIVWAAPDTGTYYVAVQGFGHDERGSYSITLTTWTGPVPTPERSDDPTPTPVPPRAADSTEYQNIITAVQSMMVDNNLSVIPNPVTANTAPCITGTQDMTAFPDATTLPATKQTYLAGTAGAADLPGFILFGHDITMDNAAIGLVNYTSSSTATYCYTVTADGRVTQYGSDGRQLNPTAVSTPQPTATRVPATATPIVIIVAGTPVVVTATPTPTAASTTTIIASVGGNVADSDKDGLGDNHNALPGSVPGLMAAFVDATGGAGSNGIGRMQFEWDLSSLSGGPPIVSAAVVLHTFKGTVDKLETFFFHGTANQDGVLSNSDFEAPATLIPGVVMPRGSRVRLVHFWRDEPTSR